MLALIPLLKNQQEPLKLKVSWMPSKLSKMIMAVPMMILKRLPLELDFMEDPMEV